jgi:hypothetical protein
MNQIAEAAQLEVPTVAMAVENSTAAMSALRQEKSIARGGENGEEQPREGGQESVIVEKKGEHAAVCKWTISQFSKVTVLHSYVSNKVSLDLLDFKEEELRPLRGSFMNVKRTKVFSNIGTRRIGGD